MENWITACIVIYNEERVIERCLKSLVWYVDEIIIIHDWVCTDNSLEICKRYTENIYIKDHHGIAEKHRPYSYELSKHEWILQLDADEFLSKPLQENLRKLVKTSTYDAFELFWPLWNGKRYITKSCFYKRALFRKKAISFVGVSQGNVELPWDRVCKIDYLLEHQPLYNNFEFYRFKRKWLPWAKIQATEYIMPFSQIPLFQSKETDWSDKIKRRLKYPLYFMFYDFFYNFLGQIKGWLWREWFNGWKIALLQGWYYSAVCYYIYQLKNEHR